MRNGFTLIELLVVVTIIVVLLALLAPAMDKAIYQAQLAVCAANMKGIATGVTIYAVQHKRWYPPRVAQGNGIQPHLIEKEAGTGKDNREPIQTYIGTKSFVDPLTPTIDYEDREGGGDIYVPYNLWWSWRYAAPPPGTPKVRSSRRGSPFTWQESDSAQEFNFYLLVGDYDESWDGGAWSNHPDREGLMVPQVAEKATNLFSSNQLISISRWNNPAGERGLLDLNFTFEDGSVSRLNDLKTEDDERTVKTGQTMYDKGTWPTRYTRLPIPLQ